MATAVVMDFKGATLDQYDKVMVLMGLDAGHDMPEGGISHWVCATDEGIRVTDVWESRGQFETFAQEQIGPFSQQAGVPEAPTVIFHDVHNHMIHGEAGVQA